MRREGTRENADYVLWFPDLVHAILEAFVVEDVDVLSASKTQLDCGLFELEAPFVANPVSVARGHAKNLQVVL